MCEQVVCEQVVCVQVVCVQVAHKVKVDVTKCHACHAKR